MLMVLQKKSGDEMETKVVKRKKADETGDSKKVKRN